VQHLAEAHVEREVQLKDWRRSEGIDFSVPFRYLRQVGGTEIQTFRDPPKDRSEPDACRR